jgi:triacylglycerol lipase
VLSNREMDVDRSWQALLRPGDATRYAFAEIAPRLAPCDPRQLALPFASLAAECCRLAYNPRPAVRRRALAEGGGEELSLVEVGSASCLVVRLGGVVVAAFRGTDEPEDWRRNFEATAVDHRAGGRVHRGFLRAYSQIEDALTTALVAPRGAAPRGLVLAGHSQGGALAVLAATHHAPAAIFTFGAPRIGDAAFLAIPPLAATPLLRVVNAFDPVPELPPAGPPFHFAHSGRLLWFDGDGTPGTTPPTLEARARGFLGAVVNPAEWRARRSEAPHWLADHAPVNYSAKVLGSSS